MQDLQAARERHLRHFWKTLPIPHHLFSIIRVPETEHERVLSVSRPPLVFKSHQCMVKKGCLQHQLYFAGRNVDCNWGHPARRAQQLHWRLEHDVEKAIWRIVHLEPGQCRPMASDSSFAPLPGNDLLSPRKKCSPTFKSWKPQNCIGASKMLQ